MDRSAESAPALVRGLVDDAGLFPPAGLSMREALERHHAEVRRANPLLTGRFVCSLAQVEAGRRALSEQPVPLALVVDAARADSADGLADELTAWTGLVESVELDATAVPTMHLASAIASFRSVASAVELFVEVGRSDVAERFEALVRGGVHAKVRCGGVRPDLFPSPAELAATIHAAVRAELSWKATAGLHHAVRGVDRRDGLVHHGVLNVLLATESATAGGAVDDVEDLLAVRDATVLVDATRALSDDAVDRTRRSFLAYGSCDLREPLEDLVSLGLVGPAATASPAGSA